MTGRSILASAIAASSLSLSMTCYAEELFTLDGKTYREEELPADLRNTIYDTKQEAHERVERAVEEYAARVALAKEKGKKVDPASVPALETLLPPSQPSDAELKQAFENFKNRMPPGTTFDQVKGELGQYLGQQKTQEALAAQVSGLEKSGRLKLVMSAPIAPTVKMDLSAYPAKGPANAVVTLVEASDYLCPHCQQANPEVEAVLKEFAGKVRFVHVNFALRPAELSGTLARGAFCARQQGDDAYWRFHETAFDVATKEKLTTGAAGDNTKATEIAKAAKVDLEKWNKCLASDEAKVFVENAATAMNAVGVTGTPAFFLNNRKLHTDHKPLREAVTVALADAAKGDKINH